MPRPTPKTSAFCRAAVQKFSSITRFSVNFVRVNARDRPFGETIGRYIHPSEKDDVYNALDRPIKSTESSSYDDGAQVVMNKWVPSADQHTFCSICMGFRSLGATTVTL